MLHFQSAVAPIETIFPRTALTGLRAFRDMLSMLFVPDRRRIQHRSLGGAQGEAEAKAGALVAPKSAETEGEVSTEVEVASETEVGDGAKASAKANPEKESEKRIETKERSEIVRKQRKC